MTFYECLLSKKGFLEPKLVPGSKPFISQDAGRAVTGGFFATLD